MSPRTLVFVAALFAVPTMAGATDCDVWPSAALPADRASADIPIDTLLAMLPEQPTQTDPESVAEQMQALDEARELLQRSKHPSPLGNISGAWKVASIQVGRTGGFSYPYFAGHIDRNACGFSFIKTKGSQRRSGELVPMPGNPNTLAFLGIATINGNSAAPYGKNNVAMGSWEDSDRPTNSVGRLLRIAPDTLVMILDANDQGVELYRLKR